MYNAASLRRMPCNGVRAVLLELLPKLFDPCGANLRRLKGQLEYNTSKKHHRFACPSCQSLRTLGGSPLN